MATTTPYYGLHQWTVRDGIRREELNEDLSKIDEALGTKVNSGELSADFSVINSAIEELEGRTKVIYGTYFGDGTESRNIYIEFTPRAILVESTNGKRSGSGSGAYGGMATLAHTCGSGDTTAVAVIPSGFTVFQKGGYAETNQTNAVYRYVAFR